MAESDPVVADSAPFTNSTIDVNGLPHLDDRSFTRLDPAFIRVRTLSLIPFTALAVIAATIGSVVAGSFVPLLAGGAVLCVVAVSAVMYRIEIDHMGYLVREHDLSFRSGVVSRTIATVPFARVQHVSIGRGPIERYFDLASLELRTAGGNVTIPGLLREHAERLEQLVADRAGALADAETDDDVA